MVGGGDKRDTAFQKINQTMSQKGNVHNAFNLQKNVEFGLHRCWQST